MQPKCGSRSKKRKVVKKYVNLLIYAFGMEFMVCNLRYHATVLKCMQAFSLCCQYNLSSCKAECFLCMRAIDHAISLHFWNTCTSVQNNNNYGCVSVCLFVCWSYDWKVNTNARTTCISDERKHHTKLANCDLFTLVRHENETCKLQLLWQQ